MPGNRELYESEINAGHEAAWNQDWTVAATHYGNALQEFPKDPEVHLNLGFALLNANRLDEALKVYSRAHQLLPSDPIPVEKSADVLEVMGRLKEAAQQYANVAELYLGQRDLDKAIQNWERATELTPGLVALHVKLAKAYRKIGDKPRALYQYLMIGYNLSRSGDWTQAQKAVEQALAINKRNVEALNAMAAVEARAVLSLPTKPDVKNAPNANAAVTTVSWTDMGALDDEPEEQESDPLGPMGMAMNDGLAMLAEQIMMSGNFDSGGVEALQAMELQRQGQHPEAISLYQSASRQLKSPALSMNLGALLLLSEQPDAAIPHLNEVTQHEHLAPGAFHALGQAFYRQEKFKRGVSALLETAQLAEARLKLTTDDRMEMQTVYQNTLNAVNKRAENDQTLGAVSKRLMRLLSGKDWELRFFDVRPQMLEAHRDGGGQRVLEFLSEDISDGVTESVAKIDRYIRQRMYLLAMDEAQYAIEKSPTYLPIHVRMAEVMMLEGRVRQAITKYNIIAKTYRVRGENARAASILSEVLEMAPLDIEVRGNLIALLEDEERWEDALSQYMELANTYRQIGNLDTARVTYVETERLAERVSASPETRIKLKHALADIDQLRMDLRRAQRGYEEIIRLDAGDERARRALVEINLQLGNQIEGIKQLDELLRLYAKQKQVKSILKVLQDLVRLYPDDSGLRSRLAGIYRQLGRRDEAVEQLDRLAQLQIDSGLPQDACETLRQIVKLNPPNVAQFEATLKSLRC